MGGHDYINWRGTFADGVMPASPEVIAGHEAPTSVTDSTDKHHP
jgi:hypothetical protein